MKGMFSKRCLAYIIDLIIITIVISCITNMFSLNKETESYKQLEEMSEKLSNNEIDTDIYLEKTRDINYQISKSNILTNIISIILYILYFVIYQYIAKGQTIGKKLLKIKISNLNGTNISLSGSLIRTLILHGVLINIILVMAIMLLTKTLYIKINALLTLLQTIVIGTSMAMVILKKDGRGIHDILSNAIVLKDIR